MKESPLYYFQRWVYHQEITVIVKDLCSYLEGFCHASFFTALSRWRYIWKSTSTSLSRHGENWTKTSASSAYSAL